MPMQRNRLMALIAANSNRPRRFEVRQAGQCASVYLFDLIDPFFGVSAAQFVKTLNSIDAPQIDLHINSPGGDVFEGRAIATAIAQHPSNITAYVDGLAASAASTVAIAAKNVVMAPGSFMMVHNAWALAYGNAAELQAMAGVLEKIDGSLAEEYAQVAGVSVEQAKAWMDAETWFTAQESVDAGLADSVAEQPNEEDDGAPSDAWNLSAFRRAPRSDTTQSRWICCGATNLPIDTDDAWDGASAANAILDNAGIGGSSPNYQAAKDGFVFCDLSNPDDRASYKEPFCVVDDGKLAASSAGVEAAQQRLAATDVPQKVREDGQRLLQHYSDRFDQDSQNCAEHEARSERLRRATYA